jgi:hypothetical protein
VAAHPRPECQPQRQWFVPKRDFVDERIVEHCCIHQKHPGGHPAGLFFKQRSILCIIGMIAMYR